MNVLSLCDGISCGRIALERAGIKVDKYYASEINEPSIKVALDNYPDIIELGDIRNWNKWNIQWKDIDLLIGGTPCQDFSQLGKEKLNFDGERSGLFFEYVNILNHIRQFNPNVKFLLENVKMKSDWADLISSHLGVDYVYINSSDFSAQMRARYYWCNWEYLHGRTREYCSRTSLRTGMWRKTNHGVCLNHGTGLPRTPNRC